MPDQVLKFIDEETNEIIYLEIEANGYVESEDGFTKVATATEKMIEKKGNIVLNSIKTLGKKVIRAAKESNPDEVEIKTGMKLKLSEGNLVAMFAKGEVEFPFEITLKWKNTNSKGIV